MGTLSSLNFQTEPLDIKEVGTILEVKKSIAKVAGFPSCIYGQLVIFSSGVKGMVIGFNEKEVTILILGDDSKVRAGEECVSQGEAFTIPVGGQFCGRMVNCLGEPLDEQREVDFDDKYPVFKEAPPVIDRAPLTETLHTGIKIIDTMIPMAKGQRELIIGDRMTGKSTIAIDAILNQQGKDVVCIYCYIGRSYFSLMKTVQLLKSRDALSYTILVAAPASSHPGEQFLAPYTACTLGEYFMNTGKDVLVIFDDLTRHAWIYRQISLLLERSPGREAYPGDVFYIHSQLMERAGRLNSGCGGGTMSFLPILETQQGDITDHISSNIVSMTDGQIYTSAALFNEGFKPSIDLGLSVSRIGNKVQSSAIKEISGSLRLEYVQYRELVRLTRMKAKLSESITERLKRGAALKTLLTQDKNSPVSLEEQIILFYGFQSKVVELFSAEGVVRFQEEIFTFLKEKRPDLLNRIAEEKILTGEIKTSLDGSLIDFVKTMGVT